jgi:hypothetical protein
MLDSTLVLFVVALVALLIAIGERRLIWRAMNRRYLTRFLRNEPPMSTYTCNRIESESE